MVKHAADDDAPLLTAAERVDAAFTRLRDGRTFTPEQDAWLGRIRQHLIANLSIERDDFDNMPILADAGGWGRANKVFGGELAALVETFNEAMAA